VGLPPDLNTVSLQAYKIRSCVPCPELFPAPLNSSCKEIVFEDRQWVSLTHVNDLHESKCLDNMCVVFSINVISVLETFVYEAGKYSACGSSL
jgi:hypothetical protein